MLRYFFFSHLCFPASGQAVVTGVVPSSPLFLPSIFLAHRVQQSHCSSIFHRVLVTQALALSASQFVHKKKPLRISTSMHSAGLELTKLTYTRLEDNLIRHRGDRCGTLRTRVYSCDMPAEHEHNSSHCMALLPRGSANAGKCMHFKCHLSRSLQRLTIDPSTG